MDSSYQNLNKRENGSFFVDLELACCYLLTIRKNGVCLGMFSILSTVTPVSFAERFERFILADSRRTKQFLTHIHPEFLEQMSAKKALYAFHRACDNTPAYLAFLRKNRVDPLAVRSIVDFLRLVPYSDKENYIKSFSYEQRCFGGKLPNRGNIDESGGTSGIATNWIHDLGEETMLLKAVEFEFDYVFDGKRKDYVVISAWSSGPWATGVKFCELMEHVALVKNTSTDSKDIMNTLRMFGTNRNYLIGAYPPFIKNLIEENPDFPWKKYNLDLVTGGEGITLDWVYYMRRKLKPGAKIVSSYGASDVDIGVGFETPFSFFIRELLNSDAALCRQLFGREDAPMVFQYNPLMHYIENVYGPDGKPEFVITLLDTKAALAKIRYNLHDEGRRFSYLDLVGVIKSHFGSQYDSFVQTNGSDILHLPFLCVFGRSDGTLSFDGANVFPHQIERGIMRNKELSAKTSRFKIEKKYDVKHNVEFHVHVELKKGHSKGEPLRKKYHKAILEELVSTNPDFKESVTQNPSLTPHVNLYSFEHPLFHQDNVKVKNIYIVKSV